MRQTSWWSSQHFKTAVLNNPSYSGRSFRLYTSAPFEEVAVTLFGFSDLIFVCSAMEELGLPECFFVANINHNGAILDTQEEYMVQFMARSKKQILATDSEHFWVTIFPVI